MKCRSAGTLVGILAFTGLAVSRAAAQNSVVVVVNSGDSVASVARIAAEDLKKAGAQLVEDEKIEPQPQLTQIECS